MFERDFLCYIISIYWQELVRTLWNNSRVFLLCQLWIVNYYIKNTSNNLSNENKYWWFFCLQDKMWIKMPKWTIFVMSSDVFVLITENFWRIFWRDNWRSLIGVVENFRYRVWNWTFTIKNQGLFIDHSNTNFISQ